MIIINGVLVVAGLLVVYFRNFPPSFALLCMAISSFLLHAIYEVFFSPLANFPGPRLWTISRVPWAWHVYQGDLWLKLGEFHQKYGPWVRVAPDEISTTVPEAWKELYSSTPLPPKDPKSSTAPPMGIHSLFTASGETHSRLRKIYVNGYSSKALRGQAPILEDYAGQFIDRVGREARKSPKVDISKLYGYATFDIITDLTYGESIHGLQGDSSHSWIERYYIQAKIATIRNMISHFPPLGWIFDAVLVRLTEDRRMRNFEEVGRKIDRRLQLDEKIDDREDLLSPVIGRISETPDKGQVTKAELIVHGFSSVVANSQVVTLVLASITYLLLMNKRAMARLIAEVDEKQFKSTTDITVEKTNVMPYMDAVINEALRIHHPTPTTLPRVIPEGGKVVKGRHLPAGSIVGVNLQSIQNAPDNWVEPEAFYPERFLPETNRYFERRFLDDKKDAFHPFSIGPRNCLGGRLFLAQTRVILTRLFYTYSVDLIDSIPPHDLWQRQAYLVFEPKELYVNLQAREAY